MKHFLVRIIPAVFILVLAVLPALEAEAQQYEEQKLLPAEIGMDDEFGAAVAVHGDLALIGAPYREGTGVAYIYRYDHGTQTWNKETKLLPSSGAAYDYFGDSVALVDGLALIGAEGYDHYGAFSGAAYVFRYDPGSGEWTEETRLLPADGGEHDFFGTAVSVNNGLALVGASGAGDTQCGAAYLFRYNDGTKTWDLEEKLLADDGLVWDGFGRAVSMGDGLTVIGAPGASDDTGAAYVFRHDGGTNTWNQEQKILVGDGSSGDSFGENLSLSGYRVLIGSSEINDETGAAYLFRYDPGSSAWEHETTLVASDGMEEDEFGSGLCLQEGLAVIGACGDDDNGEYSGSAYLFRFDAISSLWVEETKLLASDGAMDDEFGKCVALSADLALVGAPYQNDYTGAVYSFDHTPVLELDIKCQGQDNCVTVSGGENVVLTIEANAYASAGTPVDVWVLAHRVRPANFFSFGYLDEDPSWCHGLTQVYYSGGLIDLSETVWDAPLRPGFYTAYLFVETNPDGLFDFNDLFDHDQVGFTVLP